MQFSKVWTKALRVTSVVLGFGIIVCSIYPSSTSLLETWNYKSDVTKVNFDEIITRYKKAASESNRFVNTLIHDGYKISTFTNWKANLEIILDIHEGNYTPLEYIAISKEFKRIKSRASKNRERLEQLAFSMKQSFYLLPATPKALLEIIESIKKDQPACMEMLLIHTVFVKTVITPSTTNAMLSLAITIVIQMVLAFELLNGRAKSNIKLLAYTIVILLIQFGQCQQQSNMQRKINGFLIQGLGTVSKASELNNCLGIPMLAWTALLVMWMQQIESESLMNLWKTCTTKTMTKRERFFQERKKQLESQVVENCENKKVENQLPKVWSKEAEEFECPVCMDVMVAPLQIYGCSNDHLICSKCVRCVNACPICRSSFRSQKPKRRFQCETLLRLIIQKEELKIEEEEFCSKVEEMYECPVCFETMEAPCHIVGCANDHWICSTCMDTSHFESCPICRKSFKKQKPRRRYKVESLYTILKQSKDQ